jgi:membrane associated rhomboid family serine protease
MHLSVTNIIIITTVLVSISAFSNNSLFYKLEYSPYTVVHRKKWYKILTHAFIHADYMHLFVNMFVLYSFGNLVEDWFKSLFADLPSLIYLMLYIGGVAFATLPALKKHKDNYSYSAVGASGAVSAVLFTSILLNPTGKIFLFFIPIGIPAFVFGLLYLLYEIYLDKKGKDNVAHDAHIWGAIFGVIYIICIKPITILLFFEQIFS